jgi:hypothetical protein
MKKINFALLSFLFITLMIAGCKKDDDENVSYLQVNKDMYTLTHGNIEYFGKYIDVYYYAFDLLSPGMTMDEHGDWHNSGEGIWIKLISSENDGIATGIYEVSSVAAPFSITNIVYCPAFSDKITNDITPLTSGTVSVERNGKNYKIMLLGKDEDGKGIKAEFSGTLEITNVSTVKK